MAMPYPELSKKTAGVVSRQGQSLFVVKVAVLLAPGSGTPQVHRGVLVCLRCFKTMHSDPMCVQTCNGRSTSEQAETGTLHQPIIKHFVSFFMYKLATVSQQHVLNSQFALQFRPLYFGQRVMTYFES